MGVPAFYRWLISRYPKIVHNIVETDPASGSPTPATAPSPAEQYDNLYIDMNGLIHPCSHPEDRPPPTSENEIFENIGKYVDRLFAAIQPSRLLFLSIDGVAPRAKMNQQRARRYRAAQDRQERDQLTSQVISELFPDVSLPETPRIWDSNVITPGTEFMSHLSDYLHRYVEEKMRTEEDWKSIKVILSDSSVCGEGEHKIMAFIRSQRTQEGYDPNQHHVVHGLDADLIMLALGTHEPKFSILREEQLSPYEKKKEKRRLSRSQAAHDDDDGVAAASADADDWVHAQKLLCLRVEYLREYFSTEYDFLRESLGERFDLERIIDDLIFLCYFVGNDFLPHLPTLEIREGGIDLLLSAYKQLIPYWPDYLTGSEIDGQRVIRTIQLSDLLRKVSETETQVLISKEAEERKLEEIAAASDDAPLGTFRSTSGHAQQGRRISKHLQGSDEIAEEALGEMMKVVKEEVDRRISEMEKHAATAQRRQLRGKVHGDSPKDRYYNNPFRSKDLIDGRGLDRMCQSYLDGLCWVLNYYLQGPPSWEWFYPFHYAPCASDLYAAVVSLSTSTPYLTYQLDFSSPLKPVEQLLSVLPAESAHALPRACQGLMTSSSSPLVDIFHPKDISIDRCNAMSWLWILLLPFVDVNRITKASKECEPHFTPAETARNSSGTAFLYVNSREYTTAFSGKASEQAGTSTAAPSEATERDDLRDHFSPTYPLYGFVSHDPVEDSFSEDEEDGEEVTGKDDGEGERILCFQYFLPTETIHRSALIAGILPLSSPLDLRVRNKKWRGRGRGGSRGRGRGRGGRAGGEAGRGAADMHGGGKHGRRT